MIDRLEDPDILVHIFEYLDRETLVCTLPCVCKSLCARLRGGSGDIRNGNANSGTSLVTRALERQHHMREYHRFVQQYYNVGYLEALEQAKEVRMQEGFNKGSFMVVWGLGIGLVYFSFSFSLSGTADEQTNPMTNLLVLFFTLNN